MKGAASIPIIRAEGRTASNVEDVETQQATHSLRVFTFIAQIEVLLVWLIFSLLAWLLFMLYAPGIREIVAGALALVFSIPFLQYGFIIIEYTARGHDEVPRMGADILSADGRVYRQMIIATMLVSVIYMFPEEWRIIPIGVILLITPAITSFIAFYAPLFSCLNPIKIYGFISSMGLTYVVLRLLANGVLFILLYFLQRGTAVFNTPGGAFLMALSATYLTISMFRGTGVLLHTRRDLLGIRTDFSSEQAAAKQQSADSKARKRFLVELTKLARADKFEDVRKRLNRVTRRERYENEPVLYEGLREFDDKRVSHILAEGYVPRLMETDPEAAWKILETVLEESRGRYQFASGDQVIRLYDFVQTNHQKALALRLLVKFDDSFPHHTQSRQAYLLATRIACDLDDLEVAQMCFRKVTSRRGLINKSVYEECQRLLRGLQEG